MGQICDQYERRQIEMKIEQQQLQCQICYQDFDISEVKTLNCEHRMCAMCLKTTIEVMIDKGKFQTDDLLCPFMKKSGKQCNWPLERGIENRLDHGIIQYAVDQKYWDKLCMLRMRQLEGFLQFHLFSECPNLKCQGKFLVSKGTIEVKCQFCLQNFCYQCYKKPHKGNCFQRMVQEAREAVLQAGIEVRKCPHCGQQSSKEDGCEHVVCGQCKKH